MISVRSWSYPVLQVALDVTSLDKAIGLADASWNVGAKWLEAGTPLIKSVGVVAVRELSKSFPDAVVVADMKCMDAGYIEAVLAGSAGAGVVTVLGVADDNTISEVVRGAKSFDLKVMVDLINVSDPVKRAIQAEELGAGMVCFHTGIDVQHALKISAFEDLISYIREACDVLKLPVAVAGGITVDKVDSFLDVGVDIIIVGSAITKAADPRAAARAFVERIEGH